MTNSANLRITPGWLYTAGAIWPPVCIAVVAARFWTRRAQKARIGWDDWLILPALVIVCGTCAAVLAGTALGATGYPTPKPTVDSAITASSPEQTITRKIFWTQSLLNIAALTFLKISCVLFYQRIFGKSGNKTVNIIITAFVCLMVVWGVGLFFGYMFLCGHNFYYFWTTVENVTRCGDSTKINLTLGVSDLVMDVFLLLFPLPLIWRLQMSFSSRAAISFVFLLGAAAIAMSCTRMVILFQQLSVEFQETADSDFVSTNIMYFMVLETAFALCAISLPTLSGAFKIKKLRSFINTLQSSFYLSSSSRKDSGGQDSYKPPGTGIELFPHEREYTTITEATDSEAALARFET